MNNPEELDDLIESMAEALHRRLSETEWAELALVGIHTGGAWVAECLHRCLQLELPIGTLDISFYRDDFTRIGLSPLVRPSDLPFGIDGRTIVLVDDVLHTGRTVRAALNELFDYGRPAQVILATAFERPGRELPIQADVVGRHLDLAPDQHVKLEGPEPLTYRIQTAAS